MDNHCSEVRPELFHGLGLEVESKDGLQFPRSDLERIVGLLRVEGWVQAEDRQPSFVRGSGKGGGEYRTRTCLSACLARAG